MASVPIKDRKFDTQVQYLKYKVLREVARYAFEDRLLDAYTEIPKLIVKEKPTMRCCIYKERAIMEPAFAVAVVLLVAAGAAVFAARKSSARR